MDELNLQADNIQSEGQTYRSKIALTNFIYDLVNSVESPYAIGSSWKTHFKVFGEPSWLKSRLSLSLSVFLGHSRFRRDALPLMEPVEFLEFHTRKRGERMLRYLLPLSTKVCSPCIYDFNESLSNRLGGGMMNSSGCGMQPVAILTRWITASFFSSLASKLLSSHFPAGWRDAMRYKPTLLRERAAPLAKEKSTTYLCYRAGINHNSAIPREKSSLQGYLIFNFNFDNAMYKEEMADRWIKR